ncbi:MAG: transcription factor of the MADS box [Cirrosporium novae-zelandiae]|nr:MAG: transcription factor of the MADS box [Cirrosporium novae-zelandiae]
MADITDPDQQQSPAAQDDALATGNGQAQESRGTKRPRPSTAADDDDDDEDKPGRERRKIEIKFIQDKSRRHITFSKRKAGIMKKAYELSVLTGTQVLLLVVSETGLVYTFTTPKLQPLVTKPEGKNLIQACLNAPDPASTNENGVDGEAAVESPEDVNHVQLPSQQANMRGAAMHPASAPPYMTPDQQQQIAYQQYMQQQQGSSGSYPMPVPGRMSTQHQGQA